MKIRALLIVTAFVVAGACTQKPEAEKPAETSAPVAASVSAAPTACGMKGEVELLVVQASPQAKLRVCGVADTQTIAPEGKKHLTQFGVYKNDETKPIFSSNTELNSYWASVKNGKELYLEHLITVDKDVPVSGIAFKCDGEKCAAERTECLTKFAKNPHPTIVADIKKRVASGKLEGEPYYDTMIGDLIAQALGGDPAALELFKTDHAGELKVDGASAEMYEDGRTRVQAALDAGCVK